MTVGPRRSVLAGLIAGVVLGCGPVPSDAPGSVEPSASAPTSAAPSVASLDPTAGATATSTAAATIAYDTTLLEALPAEVGGLTVESAPEALADVASDPDVTAAADRIAFGIVVDPASGELAVAAVVALRSDVFDDTFWRSWRDTYDEGACAPAGGIVGHAEAELGGRLVYIGSCDAGARTYHAYLESRDVLVSITSVGDSRRLGEALAAGARD